LGEETQIPVEHLCSPDLVKRWCWDKPSLDQDSTQQWLLAQGARSWQIEKITPLLLKSLDNPEVDEFEELG
jgi:ribonuclease D